MKGKPIGGFFELETDLSGGGYFHSQGLLLNTGRACLNLILKTVRPKKVYVPYFTCDSLLDPLRINSVPFEFYALNRQLDPESLPALAASEYIIYINYFGLKQQQIEVLDARYGRHLIIDNTQAFFVSGSSDRFSFNSARKSFGVPDGAYAYGPVVGHDLTRNASIETDHLVLRSKGLQDDAFIAFKKYEANLRCDIHLCSEFSDEILRKLNYPEILSARRRNFLVYQEILGNINQYNFNGAMDTEDQVPFCYPLLLSRPLDLTLLHQRKIFVPVYWAEVQDRVDGGYFLEKDFSRSCLPLPLDHRYSADDVHYVASIVKGLT